jgi:hypothetical protein
MEHADRKSLLPVLPFADIKFRGFLRLAYQQVELPSVMQTVSLNDGSSQKPTACPSRRGSEAAK